MLEKIKNIDTELLIYLNNLGSDNWDAFWMLMTHKFTSIPVYLVILFLVYKYFGIKNFNEKKKNLSKSSMSGVIWDNCVLISKSTFFS